MVACEFREAFEARGIRISTSGLTHAILAGHLGDVPYDAAGRRIYSEEHLEKLLAYMRSPRKRGPRSRLVRTGK